MFDLKTASLGLRKAVKSSHRITQGKWEPIFTPANESDPNGEKRVVAKVYNRRFPDGVEVTEWAESYATMYL